MSTYLGKHSYLHVFVLEIDRLPCMVRLCVSEGVQEWIRINRSPLTTLPVEYGWIRIWWIEFVSWNYQRFFPHTRNVFRRLCRNDYCSCQQNRRAQNQ